MGRFILRRILLGGVALVGAMVLLFILARAAGDPRYILLGAGGGYEIPKEVWDRLGRELGLDKPPPIQFAYWVWNVLQGDFGDSVGQQRPVLQLIREKAPATVQLAISAWLLGTLIGVPLGVFSATHRGRFLDYLARGFALLGQASPSFWVGIVLIFFFAVHLQWLPVGTKGEGIAIRNFILPTITLGWAPAASYLRLTRTAMLEVLDSEYIKFARAKGVNYFNVVWKHAFKNAIIPPLTLSVFLLFGFMNGAVIVETVFSWPGLGRLAVEALSSNDFPLLSAIILIFGAGFVLVVLLLDILYALVDPRIRYT